MGTPMLREMFQRLWKREAQTRAARSVEWFGWLDMSLGIVILGAPGVTASVLHLPALTVQGSNYLRLVGLLVSGLGMLYVVSGRLDSAEFVFASILDRPLVPAVMVVLWYRNILPGPLALAFSVSDFGGFLWTLSALRADARGGPETDRSGIVTKMVAAIFRFISGVIRNARTFHPDGRTFRATVHSLHPPDAGLARASDRLIGSALLRIGMGVMKKGMPRWIADRIPDAPSIAARLFSASTPGQVRIERRPDEDLDLLCTAGGDRLWKLLLNLTTGGFKYGLHKFDYFQNVYYAQVPYRIDDGKLDVWLRLVPDLGTGNLTPGVPTDGAGREERLTRGAAGHAVIRIEVQPVDDPGEPFVPIAAICFDEEIQIDQEALHFDPVDGRGFAPHGVLTNLRKSVYPASVRGRPPSRLERAQREHESAIKRLSRYFDN
jgi:hypothetical protein